MMPLVHSQGEIETPHTPLGHREVVVSRGARNVHVFCTRVVPKPLVIRKHFCYITIHVLFQRYVFDNPIVIHDYSYSNTPEPYGTHLLKVH